MLSAYPILINNEEIPTPDKISETPEVVETVNETEAGTDLVIVVRQDKLTVRLSFTVSSVWAKKFAAYRDTEPLTVQMYDAKTEAYKTRTMRIRNYQSALIDHSWQTPGTTGLYELSFDLKEY